MKKPKIIGSIKYTVDEDRIIWMEADWENNNVEDFATLMYEVHSWGILEDTLEYIRNECESQGAKDEYKRLLLTMDKLFFPNKSAFDEVIEKQEAPVVAPTQVALNYLSMF